MEFNVLNLLFEWNNEITSIKILFPDIWSVFVPQESYINFLRPGPSLLKLFDFNLIGYFSISTDSYFAYLFSCLYSLVFKHNSYCASFVDAGLTGYFYQRNFTFNDLSNTVFIQAPSLLRYLNLRLKISFLSLLIF